MILLNKIILKACRAKPWHRYQTAEDMMSALLSFQFDRQSLRRSENQRRFERFAGLIGILGAAAVIIGLLVYFVWRLKHGK